MESEQQEKEQISRLIRESRAARGLTQQDLADMAGITLRSVQRIEKGEVIIRSDTLRIFSDKLGFFIPLPRAKRSPGPKIMFPAEREEIGNKIMLSAGLGAFFILCGVAFLFQSDTFPTSAVQSALLWTSLLAGYGIVCYAIWKPKQRQKKKASN